MICTYFVGPGSTGHTTVLARQLVFDFVSFSILRIHSTVEYKELHNKHRSLHNQYTAYGIYIGLISVIYPYLLVHVPYEQVFRYVVKMTSVL